jgi:hypothetical protein
VEFAVNVRRTVEWRGRMNTVQVHRRIGTLAPWLSASADGDHLRRAGEQATRRTTASRMGLPKLERTDEA